ncbi:MAG: FAD-dependent oxidoreductase [Thiolinea sp.]
MDNRHPVIVIGAGIIGVCTALALQQRGIQTLLLDRKPPASETSYGNAGIIALNAVLPLNHPACLPSCPAC